MRRQEGLTLTGFMVWAVVFVLVALFGFKVGPPYVEFYTIQKQLKLISDELDASATRRTGRSIASTGTTGTATAAGNPPAQVAPRRGLRR